MKIPKRSTLVIGGLLLVFLAAAFDFVFNPFGLGPESESVLSPQFFAEPVPGLSSLELLVDGEEAFERILAAIDSAERSLYVQTYIWKDDTIGQRVATKLKEAADRGVEVTVSKDALGTVFELGDMLRGKPSPVFTKRGLKGYDNITVKTEIFADTDHSKYFIVDDRVAVFGGMNIADEYHTEWHDFMGLAETERYAKAFADKVIHGMPWPADSPSAFVAVNDRNATEIRTGLIEMLDHARERVIIEHAYFSDSRLIEAVTRAAGRGVQVDLILPKEPDTHIYPNWVTTNRLLESDYRGTLKIFLYPEMTHAKVMLADGVFAAVGSANLTPRSMLTSKEVILFVHGEPEATFIRELRETLEADIAASERIATPYQLNFFDKLIAGISKYIW
jgi:cardiolipin synthase